MRVEVEWMDGESKIYNDVDTINVGSDGILRMYGYRVGSQQRIVGEIPVYGVREWRREGER